MKNIEDLLNKERVLKYSKEISFDKNFLYYDFSKTHFTDENYEEIKKKILYKNFNNKLNSLILGENINFTENRKVLHYLLRANKDDYDFIDNNKVISEAFYSIQKEKLKLKNYIINFNNNKGITNKKIKNIINIGIGGSDLGPKLICDAFSIYKKRNISFFSNIDSSNFFKEQLINIDKNFNLDETLIIVVSKSFGTIETLENMKLITALYKKCYPEIELEKIIKKHFVAVSCKENVEYEKIPMTSFKMFDFVGGRYSFWSNCLPIALSLSYEIFEKILKGGNEADKHFFNNKLESIPGMMAITEIFYSNEFPSLYENEYKDNHLNNTVYNKYYNNKCLIAYDSHLELLYKYLQQLEMESNGKQGSGQKIIWGGVGTDVQHSFFQMLHQNDEKIYLEVLLPINNIYIENNEIEKDIKEIIKDHHNLLISNCLAQTRALMTGKRDTKKDFDFKGNKPSTTILYKELTPETVGFILATYEHKVFIEGIYYEINSFDQFGVELGKKLAIEIYEGTGKYDESTKNLLKIIRNKTKE